MISQDIKKYTINLTVSSMDLIEKTYLPTGIPRNQIIRGLVDKFAESLTKKVSKPTNIHETTINSM